MRRIATATLWGCRIGSAHRTRPWAAMAFWFRLPAPGWAKVVAAVAVALNFIQSEFSIIQRENLCRMIN